MKSPSLKNISFARLLHVCVIEIRAPLLKVVLFRDTLYHQVIENIA